MSPESRFDMLPPIEEPRASTPTSHKYRWEGKWLHLSPTQILSIDLDDEAKQRIVEKQKTDQMVGRFAGILFMVVLSSICLVLLNLIPGDFDRMVGTAPLLLAMGRRQE